MHRISNGTQAAALPAPAAVTGTPGYATSGVVGITPATTIDPDAFNTQQEELVALVLAAGLTLDKTNNAQVLAAIKVLTTGRLLNVQKFATAGVFTYAPTAGTNFIEVEVQGGGGPGSGSPATGASQISCGAGGGAGAWAYKRILTGFSGATITVGAGGAPALGAAGTNGATSSFGALVSALGGSAGNPAGPAGNTATFSAPGGAAGSSGVSGDLSVTGGAGAATLVLAGSVVIFPPAPSKFSGGYGAGGIGTASPGASAAAVMGQAGQTGIVIVREYA